MRLYEKKLIAYDVTIKTKLNGPNIEISLCVCICICLHEMEREGTQLTYIGFGRLYLSFTGESKTNHNTILSHLEG